MVSIGVPESLALLHRTNPNPHAFIMAGIDQRIADTTPGGFAGWLETIAQSNPSAIVVGQPRGRYSPTILPWLRARYEETRIGEWTVFLKPGGHD